jgi:hypothetical protein
VRSNSKRGEEQQQGRVRSSSKRGEKQQHGGGVKHCKPVAVQRLFELQLELFKTVPRENRLLWRIQEESAIKLKNRANHQILETISFD